MKTTYVTDTVARSTRVRRLAVGGSLLAICLVCEACSQAPLIIRRRNLVQGEAGFREAATRTVRPVYPTRLLAQAIEGPVVVAVEQAPDGTVSGVEVLEAPHPALGFAVKEAVAQWRFKVVEVPGSLLSARVRSKLTYYFTVHNGRGVVRDPKEQADEIQNGSAAVLKDLERDQETTPPVARSRPSGGGIRQRAGVVRL